MKCSMSGFPLLHYILEFVQTYVHWVSDAFQSSHPLFPPCPPTLSLPSIRVFSNESALCMVAKVLELQLQHQSFQWIFRVDFLLDWLVCSPCCPRDSQESSLAPCFKSISFSVHGLLYNSNLTSVYEYWKKQNLTIQTIVSKVMSLVFNMLSSFVLSVFQGASVFYFHGCNHHLK